MCGGDLVLIYHGGVLLANCMTRFRLTAACIWRKPQYFITLTWLVFSYVLCMCMFVRKHCVSTNCVVELHSQLTGCACLYGCESERLWIMISVSFNMHREKCDTGFDWSLWQYSYNVQDNLLDILNILHHKYSINIFNINAPTLYKSIIFI